MQSHVKDLRIFMNAWKMADEQELNALRDVLRKACETVEALGNKNTSGSSSNTGRSSSVTGPPVTGTEMEKLFPNIYGKRGKRPGYFNVPFRQKFKKKSIGKKITRKFVCLSEKRQLEVPSIREKRELFVAALGEKKIPLPASGSNVDVIDALQEAYPALRDAGGFEYMYTDPGKKVLEIIPTGPRPTGNSVGCVVYS